MPRAKQLLIDRYIHVQIQHSNRRLSRRRGPCFFSGRSILTACDHSVDLPYRRSTETWREQLTSGSITFAQKEYVMLKGGALWFNVKEDEITDEKECM